MKDTRILFWQIQENYYTFVPVSVFIGSCSLTSKILFNENERVLGGNFSSVMQEAYFSSEWARYSTQKGPAL